MGVCRASCPRREAGFGGCCNGVGRFPVALRLVREEVAVEVLRMEERSDEGAEGTVGTGAVVTWAPRVEDGRERSGGGGGGGLRESFGRFGGDLMAVREGEFGRIRL